MIGGIRNYPSGCLAIKPTRAISKQSIIRQIKAVKRQVMSYSGFAPSAACLSAMDTVAAVALLVAEDKLNTPAGWDAVYEMRARIANLNNM